MKKNTEDEKKDNVNEKKDNENGNENGIVCSRLADIIIEAFGFILALGYAIIILNKWLSY